LIPQGRTTPGRCCTEKGSGVFLLMVDAAEMHSEGALRG
jgi:hypothetical protein